jgi:hypothetical protein
MKQIGLLILVTLIGCSTANQNESKRANEKLNASHTLTNLENALTVNENCVVFLWPDSFDIAKMKAENSEEAYNIIVDDLAWYLGQAGLMCDTLNIKSYPCNKEFIVFTNSEKNLVTLKRKELKGDMVLVNLKKEPKIEYSVNFNKDSVLKYFDR